MKGILTPGRLKETNGASQARSRTLQGASALAPVSPSRGRDARFVSR